MMDELLGYLPREVIEPFSHSPEFQIYRRAMEEDNVDYSDRYRLVSIADRLLSKLPPDIVREKLFNNPDNLNLYINVASMYIPSK